jgi:hypothetical protein
MAEKVLFEYRAEQEDDGYHYEFRRGDQHVEIKSSMPLTGLGGFGCRGRGAFWGMHGRKGWRHGMPRRAARRTLDALEQIYRDVYGEASTETGSQAETAE